VDPGTLIGIVISFIAIFGGMIMEGGQPGALLLIPALVIVFGGTFGAALAGAGVGPFLKGLSSARRVFGGPSQGAEETVRTLVGFAERARRDGLLALEDTARTIDDPFLRKGIELAVDGTDPEELRDILEAEIDAKRKHDKSGSALFADMGGYAPTMGIIGTVLGLIHVLENLSNPDELGSLIASAFVATLWGVLSANVVWLPIAKKMQAVSEGELVRMELLLEGVMSIQAGANPRVIEQKLMSYLPESERAALDQERAA
jgi:chemotaxis protein MotA